MSEPSRPFTELSADVQESWHRFLDAFEPLRPELYRYCRRLTDSAWEGEDLAQDTLMRAFVTLGTLFHELPNPRAWLLRVATNLWIDRVRRSKRELLCEAAPEAVADTEVDARAAREAAGTLLVRLSPQERAAVVLKDVFELSLEEIAHLLSTSTGAVKAALHRGRGRLHAPPPEAPPRAAAPAVLDAFVAAFALRDVERLAALLLDSAVVEIVGLVTEYGPDAPKDPETGSFAGTLSPITVDERGGVAPELLQGYRPESPRAEVREYRGQPIVLLWYAHDDGPRVRTLMTVDGAGDRISHVRNYFFSPDVIAEVCGELGVPYAVNGYRYWPRA